MATQLKEFYIRISRRRRVFVAVSAFVLVAIGAMLLFSFVGREVEVVRNEENHTIADTISVLRGEPCEGSGGRPYAVMLAEDGIARPLSGIASADIVVEMPVLTRGINRMMGIYQCVHPTEIGSVRSARHDFIPLAAGFDAIFAHWGGSALALNELNEGVIDNIDALPNPLSAFWRKSNIAAPHNGFTSWERLQRTAKGLGYRTTVGEFAGYARKEKVLGNSEGILRIEYPSLVSYEYDAESGTYKRYRSNLKERDALTQKQVEVDVVAVVYAVSRQLSLDYNDVDIEGEGVLTLFQEGGEISGIWRKDPTNIASPLLFLDDAGVEIPLVPGVLWIQIVEPGTVVTWVPDEIN